MKKKSREFRMCMDCGGTPKDGHRKNCWAVKQGKKKKK